MNVLIACEFSGVVRDAFRARGHNALSADLLPTERPGPHYQGDVRDVLYEDWDLVIAHPPCTYLANSGVRWLHNNPERWELMKQAASFFNECLNLPHVERVAVENPIPHKYARELIGNYTQIIQPWMFGHMESKATALWLRGLPPLRPTHNVHDEMMMLPKNIRNRVHYASPKADRWKDRSRTYVGIAEAMAEQWG